MTLQQLLPLKNELMRLAFRILQQREEAEDVVQDTFMKLWNQREQWPQIENMEAYALTVCRNLALDHVKAMRKQMEESLEADTEAGRAPVLSLSSGDPHMSLEQRDRLAVVRQAMNTLPEKQRTAMHLRDFEGHSYQEIAQIMDIPEAQVKVNIHRARQTIKQIFDK